MTDDETGEGRRLVATLRDDDRGDDDGLDHQPSSDLDWRMEDDLYPIRPPDVHWTDGDGGVTY